MPTVCERTPHRMSTVRKSRHEEDARRSRNADGIRLRDNFRVVSTMWLARCDSTRRRSIFNSSESEQTAINQLPGQQPRQPDPANLCDPGNSYKSSELPVTIFQNRFAIPRVWSIVPAVLLITPTDRHVTNAPYVPIATRPPALLASTLQWPTRHLH
jgi:hypothetical protein